ncbi:hypothetical protein J3458_002109 [Metarhizium acridum]|uniref:uncharacterized protein n=1 Tax=Metarhizium acridum TaxID=92637 RepID=UPI001C6B0321|nr:hypothetical protein J3458_002109 [Metarhizium acridum]
MKPQNFARSLIIVPSDTETALPVCLSYWKREKYQWILLLACGQWLLYLVNEMALEEAATDHTSLPRRARTTMFGRRTGECSDELNNLIQHASRTLVERVTRTNLELQSPDLFDHWAIGNGAS